jgi:hypothetical protein
MRSKNQIITVHVVALPTFPPGAMTGAIKITTPRILQQLSIPGSGLLWI